MFKIFQPLTFLVVVSFFITSCGRNSSPNLSGEDWKILKQEATDSLFYNPTHSKNLVKKAYSLIDDPAHIAEIDHLQANIYFYDSKPDSALLFLNRIEDYCRTTSPTPTTYALLGTSTGIRAHIYSQQNKPDSALIFYQKAYDYVLKSDKPHLLPVLCINLADSYSHTGNYELCTYYYRKALHQIDSLSLPGHDIPAIYSGLGVTYLELRNFEQSEYYFELAGQHFDEMHIMDKIFYLNARGNHYYFRKDYEKSGEYFSRLKEIVFNDPDKIYHQSLCALNLAHIFLLKEEIDSTNYYLTICEPYFTQISHETALYYIETLRIGMAVIEKNWQEVERLIRSSVISTDYIAANILNIRQDYLKEYYEKTHNYREAYQILMQEKQLEDSLRNETVKKNVAEIEFRYMQDTIVINRNHLLVKKESEAKTFKYISFGILLVCFLLIGGIVLLILYSRKQREYMHIKNRSQLINMKMENIRNRIFPHFIFNNLNRILRSPDEIETRFMHLEEMIQLLRYNLELVERHIITLQEELNFVEKYIRVEKYSLGKDFDYKIEVAPSVDADKIYIPSVMIQILVENAIKHGLKRKEGKKELFITITKQTNFVHITVTDNGPGFSRRATLSDDNTGTGLKVITQTIQLYNTGNREKIEMKIENMGEPDDIKGCMVTILLPENLNYSYNQNIL